MIAALWKNDIRHFLILLNFVAIYLVSYLVRGPLQEPTHIYPQTSTISTSAQLPRFGVTTRLHLGFALAVAMPAMAMSCRMPPIVWGSSTMMGRRSERSFGR